MKWEEHEAQKHALLADMLFGDILDKAEPSATERSGQPGQLPMEELRFPLKADTDRGHRYQNVFCIFSLKAGIICPLVYIY